MRDYDKLVKALRMCKLSIPCSECPYYSNSDTPSKECATMNVAAADAIEELLAAVPHWISVEEQLPTDEDGDQWDRCIVYTDEDTIQTLPLCKVGNGYVTHWMKVEPPQTVMQIGVINCSDL